MARYNPLILIFALLLAVVAPAQEAAKPAKKARDIQFEADQVDYDEATKRVRMVGKVKFTSEGSVLTAPVAEYDTEKQIAEFQGGVKMVGEQSTATGKEMKVWYGESRGILKGDVRIVTQNAGKKPGDSAEPTVLLCTELEYNWQIEEGVAKGGVKMRQGIKRAFADRAEIYQKRNELLLIGNVRVEQGDGDWLTASRAIYDTQTQAVRAEGRVVAKTRLEPEKEEAAEEGPPPKKSLPQAILAEPPYELLPMRDLPVVPLPWLDQRPAPIEP
jgi:lipopolysaccharide export system protein LptA